MALVQFSGALVPQLGEKPRLLPASPAVPRATYYAADARFLATKTGYLSPQIGMLKKKVTFDHAPEFRSELSLFLLSDCAVLVLEGEVNTWCYHLVIACIHRPLLSG